MVNAASVRSMIEGWVVVLVEIKIPAAEKPRPG
jgi:hypothetical protein